MTEWVSRLDGRIDNLEAQAFKESKAVSLLFENHQAQLDALHQYIKELQDRITLIENPLQ